MIECERSYVLTHEDGNRLLEKFGGSLGEKDIYDYYLDKNTRLRQVDSSYLLTMKQGNKADGHRTEQEEKVSEPAAAILKTNTKLTVKKTRKWISLPCDSTGTPPPYKITIDFVSSPMRLAILEIEAQEQVLNPFSADISKRLLGIELKECPLSAWSLFKQKVGICGAPSSGKTETAKWMSHTLNTRFGANSFHVTEFATSFIQKYKRNPKFHDQFFVWYGQRQREMDAQTANIVISDCPTFLSYIYMVLLNQIPFSEDTAMYLAKVYKRVLFDLTSYTNIIFLNIKNYVENNVRYQTVSEAKEIEERISRFLKDHNIPHLSATYNDGEKLIRDLFYINELGSV